MEEWYGGMDKNAVYKKREKQCVLVSMCPFLL